MRRWPAAGRLGGLIRGRGPVTYCVECGAQVLPDWKHCAACGASTQEHSATPEDEGNSRPDTSHVSWRARRKRYVVASIVIVLAIGVAGLADWYSRNTELSDLISASDRADRPLERWLDDVATCASGRNNPECAREATSDALAAVLPIRERIAHVRVMPWHFATRRARQRTLDYYDAYVQAMKDFIRGPENQFEISWGEVRAALRAGRAAVNGAIPWIALFSLDARVDETWGS